MNERALNYLGLAKKAGSLQVGDEMVGAAVRAGHARLVVVASDAGDHTLRRAANLAKSWNTQLLRAPWSKEELGLTLGARSCALAAFTEPRLALACLQALDPPPEQALLDTLTQQVQRADQRQTEARAHEKNRKHTAVRRKRTK